MFVLIGGSAQVVKIIAPDSNDGSLPRGCAAREDCSMIGMLAVIAEPQSKRQHRKYWFVAHRLTQYAVYPK